MITTQSDAFEDEGSTEHPSKKARLASPDVEDADQSEDDDSDDDHQLEGAASSSKSGGVTSCSKSDDKARDSTKTRLKARGPGFAPVLRPEGSRDIVRYSRDSCRLGHIRHRRSLRSSHLFLKWTATILSYTGPISSRC